MMPLILKMHITKKDGKGFNIWLPLFLIWLIILPLVILVSPIVGLVALILWPSGKGRTVIKAYLSFFYLIWNMSGLRVDIKSENNLIFLNLI